MPRVIAPEACALASSAVRSAYIVRREAASGRGQLALLEGDGRVLERVRERVQAIAGDLLGRTSIPAMAVQAELLDAVAGDLVALEEMLVEAGAQPTHLERARADAGSLGLFVRSLVGLDRSAAMEAFAQFLDASTHSLAQIRLVEMIVAELTRNGVMEPGRLYESPFTDDHPRGVDELFSDGEFDTIVDVLRDVRERAEVA